MKIIRHIIFISITCIFITSCSDEGLVITENLNANLTKEVTKSDDVISTASLPQAILNYVIANYPDVMIYEAELESNGNYEVTLANDIELIFNTTGEFLGIDDDGENDYGDSHIDIADLPQTILDFISTNYPDAIIEEAEIENNGNFEVELNNDMTLVFDEFGNFLGTGVDHSDMDDENDDDEDDYSNIDLSDLPQPILDYILANYSEETIIQAEIEDNGYFEVTLGNGIELYFDSEGNFISAEDENGEEEDNHVDASMLPQAIVDYVATYYPDEIIVEAEIESNGEYEITLSNELELYFDENGNFLRVEDADNHVDISMLPQTILDYVATYYPDETIVEAEIESNGEYEITLSNGLELYFDENGNFLRVDDEDNHSDDEENDHETMTAEEFSDYLVSCPWLIDEVDINDHNIEELREALVTFVSDGTLTAELNNTVYTGTWSVVETDYGLKLSLMMSDGLTEINNDWLLDEVEIEDDGKDHIEFKVEEDVLKLIKNCD